MEIRHAEPQDAEGIHDIALKSWKDAYSRFLSEDTIEEVIEDWYSVEDLEEETGDQIFYVAEKDGKVVGFVHATIEDGGASLHRIYLDPDYQRQGIGSKLYERMMKELPETTEKIELEVLAENKKGKSFYRKKGFETQETEEIELKGEKVEQKILVKRL
ncbi:MAG: N-acetyltransferase family protein [Candidatus Nanohaloarchaea archaeon]